MRASARSSASAACRPALSAADGTGAVAKIIDTSVIVDGRVLEIVESGFLEGPLVVPRFVLRELQLIADSVDAISARAGGGGSRC